MLRHPRLTQPELLYQLADQMFSSAQQIEDLPPVGLGKGFVGRRHSFRITIWLYILQGIYAIGSGRRYPAARRGVVMSRRRAAFGVLFSDCVDCPGPSQRP